MAEVPKIVVRQLQATAKPDAHPDLDLINAFVEKSLNPRDRDQVLKHLTKCADCREIASLSLPEMETSAVVAVEPRASWLHWPVLRWSAVAACAVIVGTAVTLHYQPRSNHPIVQSDAAISPAAGLKNESRPGTMVAPTSVPASLNRQGTAGKLPAQAPSAPAASQMTAPASGTPYTDNGLQKKEANRALPASEAVDLAESNATQVVPGRAKDALQPSAASPAAAVGGGMLAKQKVALSSSLRGNAPLSLPLVPRWTLSSDGTLQRSLDSGNTWQTIPTPGRGNFRALAASGSEIWVGGTKGALYHSTDAGTHWTQVQPVVDGQALTADITGIEFTDSQHGTLTTVDRETWVTADSGQTWDKK